MLSAKQSGAVHIRGRDGNGLEKRAVPAISVQREGNQRDAAGEEDETAGRVMFRMPFSK